MAGDDFREFYPVRSRRNLCHGMAAMSVTILTLCPCKLVGEQSEALARLVTVLLRNLLTYFRISVTLKLVTLQWTTLLYAGGFVKTCEMYRGHLIQRDF